MGIPKHRKPSPFKSSRKGIIYDKVNPSDFLKLDITYACEQCTHFDLEEKACTFGYNANYHMRAPQLESFSVSGRMAFCRFSEID